MVRRRSSSSNSVLTGEAVLTDFDFERNGFICSEAITDQSQFLKATEDVDVM